MVNKSIERFLWLALASFLVALLPLSSFGDVEDPFDPFDSIIPEVGTAEDDKQKSAEELISEAELLMLDERPLDGRTKLLRALKKSPNDFRIHMMLSGYYLAEVGHFRLALKYVKRSLQLFEEKNGASPYTDEFIRNQHAHLLNLYSQARLNLDNYEGALEVLDEYNRLGYYSNWYAGSRAWILMKLGRLDDAIKAAKVGMLSSTDPGRTLNVLGILLSMNHQRRESLAIFEKAILYEFSLGSIGNPATPLNNAGEVYREIFEEDNAEKYWIRSTGLPDGCEHVLPSLNLAILYIEQTKYQAAKSAMDRFESCIAQFPLRNGEEHRALVHLARGRIDLHTGYIDSALEHLEAAAARRQWFGKIGASGEDLQAGVLISLAQALNRKRAHSETTVRSGLLERSKAFFMRVKDKLRSWWSFRRARQILSEELNSFEDLYVRHTDSVLEYPSLGEALAGFPSRVLEKRVEKEIQEDGRPRAEPYYAAYLAENFLKNGYIKEGTKKLNEAMGNARSKYDQALTLHLLNVRMRHSSLSAGDYLKAAEHVYFLSRASLRNYGHKLPVNFELRSPQVASLLSKTNFELDNNPLTEYSIRQTRREDGNYRFEFRSRSNLITPIRIEGVDLLSAINQLNDAVFSMRLN